MRECITLGRMLIAGPLSEFLVKPWWRYNALTANGKAAEKLKYKKYVK